MWKKVSKKLSHFDWKDFEILLGNKFITANNKNFHSQKYSTPKRSEDVMNKKYFFMLATISVYL